MGMNMVSKGCEVAVGEIRQRFRQAQLVTLTGNTCTDKKPSAGNWVEGRGKSVVVRTIYVSCNAFGYIGLIWPTKICLRGAATAAKFCTKVCRCGFCGIFVVLTVVQGMCSGWRAIFLLRDPEIHPS